MSTRRAPDGDRWKTGGKEEEDGIEGPPRLADGYEWKGVEGRAYKGEMARR